MTNGWSTLERSGGVCIQWFAACHLSSHGIGKRYWKVMTLQRRLKRAKHADGSLDCPPSRDTSFSPQGTSYTLDLRVLIGQVRKGDIGTTRETCHGHADGLCNVSESNSVGTDCSVESPSLFSHPSPEQTVVNLEGVRARRSFGFEPFVKCVKRHFDDEPHFEILRNRQT